MNSSKWTFFMVTHVIYAIQAMPSNKVMMPKLCEEENFCFESYNYPQEKIDAVLENYNIAMANKNTDTETEQRIDADENITVKQFCDVESLSGDNNLIHFIRDSNDDVRHVVQSEKHNFIQNITVFRCRNPGPLEYSEYVKDSNDLEKLLCVNQTVAVSFLVLSQDEKNLEMAEVKEGLPMACSCELNKNKYSVTDDPIEDYDIYN